ncbi:MAG: hypothetical protein ACO2PN_16020 [Pyrobaculum sp.]|jgi:hypothetical protein
MRILEELGIFIISLALALAILGVAAVMLYYFNPQQPVDHAKAAFYPLVKPINATHVWLGVKPSADKVEVVELKYQYRGRWVDVPVARFTADRTVWFNATDGRPVALPCYANVTVATRYGAASRAVSFTPVCLQRQPQIRDDLTVLLEQMVSYGSYVLDYVAYKSTPVLTAYFGFGSMHIGFQNIGPFPYMAVRFSPTGGGLWPPSVYAVSLTPGEYRNIGNIPSGAPAFLPPAGCIRIGSWEQDAICGVMYRWMNIYVYWNDTLEIWINNVRVYNGTPPATAAEYTAPQGFTVAFDPNAGTLTIKYPSVRYDCHVVRGCSNFYWTQRTALTLSVSRGATQRSGWVEMINTPAPTSPVVMSNVPWNVMPAGPYVGWSGGFELFGVVPPFEVYSVYAAVNGSGLVVRVGDPNCGVSERCIHTLFYPQPGAYRIDTGINTPAGMPVYVDSNYIIAITSTFSDYVCSRCATIGWYVPGVSYAVFIRPGSDSEPWHIGAGPYTCIIRTDGFRNTVPFAGRYWQIDCGKWGGTWGNVWESLGVVKLVFNNNDTVSVYKDGQYLYNVRVDICRGSVCVGAPTQRLTIPVSWGPDGIAMGVAQFRYNRHSVGYGEGVIRVRDVQTVAMPYYYRYNLTGAYPYRLDVQITTAEKKVAEADGWIYINVTYSGYLKLYLGDQLVAYDALYGWTIKREQAPPPREGVVSDRPEPTCVPQKARKPKGLLHRNLEESQSGYSVEVLRRFEVREFGCGIDRTYEETISAGVYTATGTSYHVKDPKNRVCGFKQARNCHGVVYCDVCPGEQAE